MSELIPITAVIGDRTYRIKIEPQDEEMVRRTLKAINDKILEFKTQFAGKDMQDYIAMVLIWLATEQNDAGNHNNLFHELGKSLSNIENLLDKQLQS
jgi:hypothetical protein